MTRLRIPGWPVFTFTGNLRAAAYGAEGMLAGLDGSYLPFAITAAERQATSDPRRAVRQRFQHAPTGYELKMQVCSRGKVTIIRLPRR